MHGKCMGWELAFNGEMWDLTFRGVGVAALAKSEGVVRTFFSIRIDVEFTFFETRLRVWNIYAALYLGAYTLRTFRVSACTLTRVQ